jgi:hypothetical protein
VTRLIAAIRGASPRRRALAVALGFAMAAVGFAAPAQASDTFYYDINPPGARQVGPSTSALRAVDSAVDTGRIAQAGAHYPGGYSLYANWAEATTYACHPYNAGNTLGAMLQNKHSVDVGTEGTYDTTYNFC